MVLNLTIGPLMTGWPLALRLLVTVTLQVGLMTYVIMAPPDTPSGALHLSLNQKTV